MRYLRHIAEKLFQPLKKDTINRLFPNLFLSRISGTTNLHKLTLVIIALMPLLLGSCADDLGIKTDIPENENFTGITLMIPNLEEAAEYGATRADGHANAFAFETAKEGNFNTLYISAINNQGKVQTFLKTASNGPDSENPGYQKYHINLQPGEYKIYVVANLNRYLPTTYADEAISEEKIKKIVLNFSADRPLEPGFLPMACLADDIKVGPNAADAEKPANGTVTIEENSNQLVFADLKFLCSKVRYTILFDREDSDFKGTTDILNFNRHLLEDHPYASKMRSQTPLKDETVSTDFISDGNATTSNPSSWSIFLDRYHLPNATEIEKLKGNNKEEIKEVLNNLTLWDENKNDWNEKYANKRAWQGVAYLPENLLTGNGERTTLSFPYTVNGAQGAYSPRSVDLDFYNLTLEGNRSGETGLKRAISYELIIWAKSADPASWKINVVPSEWTVQELAYQLHGPYELVVETTEIQDLSMKEEAEFWFRSDVPPSQIGFLSPQVSITGVYDENTSKEDMRDLFVGYVVKDENGNYKKNENGDYLFHVGLNNEIPYRILHKLNTSTTGYGLKDISFFHIVAGSLYKRIEIKLLDYNPYLIVTPQTYIIDTRELYTSGMNNSVGIITFETNVDPNDENMQASFKLTDNDGLMTGKSGTNSDGKNEVVLQLSQVKVNGNNILSADTGSVFNINVKTGKLKLDIKKIIDGNSFWNITNEFTFTFTLTIPGGDNEGDIVLEETVRVKIHPFSGNYVIHFRDNTKPWAEPHIWVYQLLTLPVDLPKYDFTDPEENKKNNGELHDFAGKIVGYIENNPSSGLQWNGATQYIFSNNVGFRGWKGYGGPVENDPWEPGTLTYDNPQDKGNSSTYGFVMLGEQSGDGSWNTKYNYNVDGGTRYNFDINFNEDHEYNKEAWSCWECQNMNSDYNGGDNNRFYTGIAMEREADGWWKYTLSGVAQPGRTMIVFANYHAPWSQAYRDYTAEDNRWPGDYETGVPLYDFEDNEGWFLFNGNTTDTDQKFVDDKPVSQVIPHKFTSTYTNRMRIEVKNTSVTSITVAGTTVSRTGIDNARGVSYFDVTNVSATGETMNVTVSGKTYKVGPKFFKRLTTTGFNGYVTAEPLYTEFDPEMKIFVKWNEHVNGQGINNGDAYNPGGKGNNSIEVYWGNGNSSTKMKDVPMSEKEYGNYKYNLFYPSTAPTGATKDQITFQLKNENNSIYKRTLKVEDLPEKYIPANDYYLINVHMLLP